MAEAEELADQFGYWNEHPKYPWSDWVGEVEANDTRKGYWEWVEEKLEAKEQENEMAD